MLPPKPGLGVWVEVREAAAASRGLFAVRDIPAGTAVLAEEPWVAVRLSGHSEEDPVQIPADRSIRACARCLRPIGPLAVQLQRAAGLRTPPAIPALADAATDHAEDKRCVPCGTDGCGAEWCDRTCHARDAALHAVICSDPWGAVRAFGAAENIIFDTAGRCLVVALARHVNAGVPMADALAPLLDCVSGDWWDLLELPEEVPAAEEVDFRRAMREVVARGHTEVATAIKATELARAADPADLVALCDEAVFNHVVGVLHLNAIEVDIADDPVVGVLTAVAEAPAAFQGPLLTQLDPVLRGLAAMAVVDRDASNDSDESDGEHAPTHDKPAAAAAAASAADDGDEGVDATVLLDTALGAAPTLEGTGLYVTLRFCNHACAPNAEVRFEEDFKGAIVTVEPVSAGSEVCISYFDAEGLSLEDRTDEMKSYGVDACGCTLCVSERS